MPHVPEDTDPNSWHRYFAMEANNRAWTLASDARTSEHNWEMLSAAEASLFHWSKVGSDLNVFRAKMLVAEARALLGQGEAALAFATEVAEYFQGVDAPDWELAYVQTILAHAAKAAGADAVFTSAYDKAKALVDTISDPEDKAIVVKTFDQI